MASCCAAPIVNRLSKFVPLDRSNDALNMLNAYGEKTVGAMRTVSIAPDYCCSAGELGIGNSGGSRINGIFKIEKL